MSDYNPEQLFGNSEGALSTGIKQVKIDWRSQQLLRETSKPDAT